MQTVDASADPRYRKLVEEYRAAFRQFKIAAENRKRVRDLLAVRRSPVLRALAQHQRRPVGSPADFRIPRQAPPAPRPINRRPDRRIYLGPILGFATIIYTPSVTPSAEPDPWPEIEQVYGEMSRQLYWNAKAHLEKCEQALLDYTHRTETRADLRDAAAKQMLGIDDTDETMEALQRDVEVGCQKVWALYERDTEKGEATMHLLLETLADAQFVGLESPTAKRMQGAVNDLASRGVVRRSP